MIVRWNHRKADGSKESWLFDEGGERHELRHAERSFHVKRGMSCLDNGIVGGPAALAAAQEKDRQLGVSDKIQYVPLGNGAYSADHKSVGDYEKWMRAHKRVNTNAGCGTPAPGDFRSNTEHEFQDFRCDDGIGSL